MADSAVRRVCRATAGLALGGASAFAEFGYVLLALPALAVPAARHRVFAGARVLAELERARLARFLASDNSADYTGRRALEYLALRSVVGGIGAGIFLLILWGAVSAGIMARQLATGRPIGGGDLDGDWYDPITVVLFGTLLVFLAVQGLVGVAVLDRRLAHRFLGPSEQELLRRRVSELATTRAEVVAAVNDERRRIERDLHDGVQQRLVALGMLLGRARRTRDAEHVAELLRQAHDESQEALQELREVTWRVYPIALDSGGLQVALESLAERSSLPVTVDYALVRRPDEATETVAYFVASEAVTNAIKHAGASRIGIAVEQDASMIVVRITDDGTGGASADGGGLSGLARRVAAADGVFSVDSPPGGPTTVTAELPCA
ncbi:sensor histidine kinase [Prauserella muralis]|uniref:histidine kinase n=1 Tax=Prauserella muralis TaxID=588067 RepID=A0A2V4BAN8_9PSEU|nr:sensor histidine kinase [Prauserella muralis]PXY32141.1 ATPase [Prauserella muralis]TWE24205.1 signal transduction histidine kinase [Prauserella muralis]